MKNVIVLLIALFAIFTASAQDELNAYKYVIVESQYEFQNDPNEFDLNELAVFLLQKTNIKAIIDKGALPEDTNRGTCNSLRLKLDKSGTLSTNLEASFVDCSGNIIFKPVKGKSKKKEYRGAYHEALRETLDFINTYTYVYDGDDSLAKKPVKETAVNKDKPEEVVTVYNITPEQTQVGTERSTDTSQSFKFQYANANTAYTLLENEQGYALHHYGKEIGTLKKAGSQNFIVKTIDFQGIAYYENDNIIVEYDKEGKSEKIVLFPLR